MGRAKATADNAVVHFGSPTERFRTNGHAISKISASNPRHRMLPSSNAVLAQPQVERDAGMRTPHFVSCRRVIASGFQCR